MTTKKQLPPLDDLLDFIERRMREYQSSAVSQGLARSQGFHSMPPPPVSPSLSINRDVLKAMLKRQSLKDGLLVNLAEALYPLGITVTPLGECVVFVIPYGLRPIPYGMWFNGHQYVTEPIS